MRATNKRRRLVKLEQKGKVVFVGDTHGQCEVTERVLDRYLGTETVLVFLGDYVDRGPRSKDNVDAVVAAQTQFPGHVVMLQGNHEGYRHHTFAGADFWREIGEDDFAYYRQLFDNLPLAVSVGDIIATHAALPSIAKLEQFNDIENGDEDWNNTVWGDWTDRLYPPYHDDRPTFSERYFDNVMRRIGKKLLIRSHDPRTPLSLYMGKCVTLKTYLIKDVAIADYTRGEPIQHLDDLSLETV